MHGRNMGSHGWGARKKHKKSGHRGGKGMSGSGKRSDQKKTLVTKLYGNKYFGKQGVTSRGTKRDTRKRINLRDIELNLGKYQKNNGEINLKGYKILGTGEINKKLIIKAKEASASAIRKVEKLGGQIFLSPKFAKKEIKQTQPVEKAGGKIILKEQNKKESKEQ